MIITIQDFRKSGYCVSGIKSWFEDNNLDFSKFLREGISRDEILPYADFHVLRTIEQKEKNNG